MDRCNILRHKNVEKSIDRSLTSLSDCSSREEFLEIKNEPLHFEYEDRALKDKEVSLNLVVDLATDSFAENKGTRESSEMHEKLKDESVTIRTNKNSKYESEEDEDFFNGSGWESEGNLTIFSEEASSSDFEEFTELDGSAEEISSVVSKKSVNALKNTTLDKKGKQLRSITVTFAKR